MYVVIKPYQASNKAVSVPKTNPPIELSNRNTAGKCLTCAALVDISPRMTKQRLLWLGDGGCVKTKSASFSLHLSALLISRPSYTLDFSPTVTKSHSIFAGSTCTDHGSFVQK